MRRFGLACLATTALAFGGASTAAADFHFACSSAQALPGLQAEGVDLVFSASVTCHGSRYIGVSRVPLILGTGPLGSEVAAAPAAECLQLPDSQEHCDTVTTTGRATTAVPGIYTVQFDFTVEGSSGQSAQGVPRAGRWLWTGFGQPRLLCGGTDAPPRSNC